MNLFYKKEASKRTRMLLKIKESDNFEYETQENNMLMHLPMHLCIHACYGDKGDVLSQKHGVELWDYLYIVTY